MKSNSYSSQVNSTSFNEIGKNLIKKEDVTIVVPTLNEEGAIELVLKDILLEGYPKMLVIDGNSIDKTFTLVKNMQIPIYPQSGMGKTGAIRTALNYIETPYFGVIDGDYTYSAKDLEALLEKAPHNNQVIGARRDRANIKALNRFGNGLINLLFNLSFGTRLTDVCSGLYVLNTSFAKGLVLETGGFDVEVEIAAQAAKSRKIAEVPISYGSRIGIQKLNPLRDGFLITSSIIKLSKKYNPLMFYSYFSGFLFAAVGFGYTILASLYNLSFPILSLLSVLFMGVGVLLFTLALLFSKLKHVTENQLLVS
jgi:dolichol-phosphate mannosyltransferase